MMFKDRNKNYRGVRASATMQPCFQLRSTRLQQTAERMNNQPLAGGSSAEPFEKSEKTKSTSLKSFSLKKSEDKNILNMCAIRLPENVCDGHTLGSSNAC